MRFRIAASLALAIVLFACTEPSGIIGGWQETTEPYRQLILAPNHTFISASATGEVFNRGTYAVDGNRITFTPMQFDNATFELLSGTLILRYTTYPFDGPQPTTMTLARR